MNFNLEFFFLRQKLSGRSCVQGNFEAPIPEAPEERILGVNSRLAMPLASPQRPKHLVLHDLYIFLNKNINSDMN